MTPALGEALDVLWLTAGLGCDGDTISITAATQPNLEDLVLGAELSTDAIATYGRAIRKLRQYTQISNNTEPEWRHR